MLPAHDDFDALFQEFYIAAGKCQQALNVARRTSRVACRRMRILDA
jgi:hypothetical protein